MLCGMRTISRERIGEYIKEAFLVLKEQGGSLPSRKLLDILSTRLQLTDVERERYEKSGAVRWETTLRFYSIGTTKAGWLRKQKGYWILTPEGEEIAKLSPKEVIQRTNEAYERWHSTQPKVEEPDEDIETPSEDTQRSLLLEQAESNATAGIEEFVRNLNAYDFQDLVAALLRAMGFHIPFVAPKGKDGGVDIIAYKDPLGASPPRIKVQVKHRQEKCGPQTVRELLGVIRKEGEVGLIVASGGFTTDALVEIQKSPVHIEAIDLTNLISLWQKHYEKVDEEDKHLLPLRQIAFLDDEE